MSVLSRIAFFQNRRDEVPNQELARDLAASRDAVGSAEIAANLCNKNKSASDCLKVLYEIGYIDPPLIAGYVGDFLKLLQSKNNRMVWGAMIGLGVIAHLRPADIWAQIDDVIAAVEHGSLITVVWGVRALANVAAADSPWGERIFPVLLMQLKTCIPRDVPTHAESMACAVTPCNKAKFLSVLESRQAELTPSQHARLEKAMRGVQA